MQAEWGKGVFYCDARFPQSILKLCRAGLNAKPYSFKREDGLRELGSRFSVSGDGQPRQFISRRCVNFISELLEYREDVKQRDHAVDALGILCLLSLLVRLMLGWVVLVEQHRFGGISKDAGLTVLFLTKSGGCTTDLPEPLLSRF